MDSFFDTVAGLPVHPLAVHAAVVLVPLSALGAVLMAFWPAFSRRFGVLVVVVAVIGVAAAFVARASGEQLALRVGVPEQHAELGNVLPVVAAALAALIVAFWLFDRGIPANKARPGWLVAVAVLLALVAAGTIALTVQVGHTGAQAVWSKVVASTGAR